MVSMPSDEVANRKPVWKMLVLVGLVAIALRFTLFLAGPRIDVVRAYEPDSVRYIELADNLIHKQAFALDHGETPGTVYYPIQVLHEEVSSQPAAKPEVWPEGIRTPGYPAYLAAVMATPLGLKGAIIGQCILSALAVVIVAWTALMLRLSLWQAAVAGLIVSVHPADIASANTLLSETLFTFAMVLSLGLILLAVSHGAKVRWVPLIVGSTLLGLGSLIRPVSLVLGPALAIWIVVTLRNRAGVGACAAAIVLTVLPGAAWCLRNLHAGLGFRLSTVTTVHVARTASFMPMNDRGAFKYPEDFWPYYDEFFKEVRRDLRPGEDPDAAIVRVANHRIRENPRSYAKLMLRSASKTLTDHSAGSLYSLLGLQYTSSGLRDKFFEGRASLRDFLSASLLVPLTWTGWNILLALLAILGLVKLALRRQWANLLLLAGIMAYFIIGAQYHGDERMRISFLGIEGIAVAAGFLPRRGREASSGSSPSSLLASEKQTGALGT